MKKVFVILSVVFLWIWSVSAFTGDVREVRDITGVRAGLRDLPPAATVKVDLDTAKWPLYFISNKGQVNRKAKFYAKASRYTLWLTEDGLTFDRFRPRETIRTAKSAGTNISPGEYQRDVSRLAFIGSNRNPLPVPHGETKARINYFIGNDKSQWHCDIPTSQAVLYTNLYKNIDLKVYGIEKQIEYDWIVKPGGNPGDIQFEYQNVKNTWIDDYGNLVIDTEFGKLVHKKPVSYQYIGQKKVPVEAEFKKTAGNRFGFRVGNFDTNRELIIDPVILAYSTYLGGSSSDFSYDIAADNSGNVYVTGYTLSNNFPTCNPYQTYSTYPIYWLYRKHVFVTKIDTAKSGTAALVYSTYLGGNADDYGYGIAVDNSGCVYVTGVTESNDFPILDQYQTPQGGSDVFISKIDTTLTGVDSLVYSTCLGGWGNDEGLAIAADNSGNAYVTGCTQSNNFPTLNPYQEPPVWWLSCTGMEAFVTRIDTTRPGTAGLVYSTYLGGRNNDIGKGIAVDSSGNAYVTGCTDSYDFPTLNQYQSCSWGWYSFNAFITRIDTTRAGAESLIYSTCLGGYENDKGYAIAVDNHGNAYVTGVTHSNNFPARNAYREDKADWGSFYSDAFAAKIDTNGSGDDSLVYSTYLGSQSDDAGKGIAVNGHGEVYVAGYTKGCDFPLLNEFQGYPDGGYHSYNAFTVMLDTMQAGTAGLIYSTYLGGNGNDEAHGIALDSSGFVYLTGHTLSTNFPLLNQYMTYQSYSYEDTFITKLICSRIKIISPNGGENWEVGSVQNITWTGQGPVGNVRIEYSSDNGTTWTEIVPSTSNDGSHPWTVPGNVSPQCLVRISEIDGSTADTSDSVFSIVPVPGITVTSPNGGGNFEINSIRDITWTSTGIVGNVKIEYSIDNGANWIEIASSTENDGLYYWIIPNTISAQCRVRVSETDGSPTDTGDDVFAIVDIPGITVTSPNGGEELQAGSQQTVTWTYTGIVDNVKIEYSTDNGAGWTEITPSTANDGSHPWTIPNTLSTQCLIRISESDGEPSDTSDNVFSIVNIPTVTVTSPNGGEEWQVGSLQTVTWNSTGTVGNIKIEYSTDNGITWTEIVSSVANEGSYPWTVPDTISGQCFIRVSEIDGSPLDVSDSVFSIVPLPTITVVSPNGSENWKVGPGIILPGPLPVMSSM